MIKISIIVPVYNAEMYIKRCVDSLVKQTLKDIEIILVDDGSTDDSSLICDNLAEEDDRIVVLHKRNGGPGDARNVGISNARGEYIGFVDADDWVTKDMYEYLYYQAVENSVDICSGKFALVSNDKQAIPNLDGKVCVYRGIEKLRVYLEIGMKNRVSEYSSCTKIYKRELFDFIKFPTNQRYEDQGTNFLLIEKANAYAICNKNIYFYFLSQDSRTRNLCAKKDFDLISVGKLIAKKTHGTELENLGYCVYGRTFYSLLLRCLLYGMDDTIVNKQATIFMLHKKVKKYFPYLIKSELPFSRKIVLIFLQLNPRLLILCSSMLKKLDKNNIRTEKKL